MARAVVVNPVLGLLIESQLQEGEMSSQDPHTPKLTVRQRQGKLFDELDLSGLDSWLLELADAICHLLMEYHNVFSLDPMELGCTHSTEHMIKVTDDTPFKENVDRFPRPWSRRFEIICGRCWNLALPGLGRVHGAMLWCCSGRRMEAL